MGHTPVTDEKAHEGNLLSMVDMVATVKLVVGGDTSPGLADDGGGHAVE
jgi:hypothetical protein